MMADNAGFSGGYYRDTFEAHGESEGSGSSGRVDTEFTASEDSCTPTRKCIRLNSNKETPYGVSRQVISPSSMSQSERKDLINRLRLELEQTKIVLKKAELQGTNGPAVSSTSDIISSSNPQKQPRGGGGFRKSSVWTAGSGKKVQSQVNSTRGLNRGSMGRFESAKQAPVSAANVMLMKQCETVLKRLMSHQYSWVFNTPVDVVKLNIPDYFTVIKHPMDLGTVKNKLNSGVYSNPLEFAADVRLTFTNARTYNPPGHDVHVMADTLSKFFEVRWKTVEKKLPTSTEAFPGVLEPCEDVEIAKPMPPAKRRKTASPKHEIIEEPVKRVMTEEERRNFGRQLESLLEEIPEHIIDFLKKHSSNGMDTGDDEIEIDIDVLSDEILFDLRKLLDDYLREKQKKQSNIEPCEIELLNGSGQSNRSMQNGNDLADENVGGNEPPVSGSSSDSESDSPESGFDGAKAMSQENTTEVLETVDTEAQIHRKTIVDFPLERSESASGLDQLENSRQKPSSAESDNHQDGNSAQVEKPVPSEKLYRAALLKNRFADIILKAREKALPQNDKGDPEKLRREREEIELQKEREKARLQAEAKAAEDARKEAEAEAAAEAKRKRELEREAARQALLKMEKTVEINENSMFLEDLKLLSTVPPEHLPSSADETSPEHSLEGLGSFKFGGSNPLEQLGLYMKQDEEEEEPEPPTITNPVNDVEEGEID